MQAKIGFRYSFDLDALAVKLASDSGFRCRNGLMVAGLRTFALQPWPLYFAAAVAELPARQQEAVDRALRWNIETGAKVADEQALHMAFTTDHAEGMELAREVIDMLLKARANAIDG